MHGLSKVRLATACERAGLPMAGIAAAVGQGRLSFEFLEAMGFARTAPDELVREDELEVVPLLQLGLSSPVHQALLASGADQQTARERASQVSMELNAPVLIDRVLLAESLAVLVGRSSREHAGVPVKWLDDGVMVSFRNPAGAVLAALQMVEQLAQAGLPPAHVGVAAGPVVVQAGDYFGRTVNLAARIAAYASAGRVLVSEPVAEAAPPEG